MNSYEVIEKLREHDLLKVIDSEVNIYLEAAHLAYIEVKKRIARLFFLQM